jgi:hypothetical protein
MTPLAPHIEAFFREHLVRHRGVSPHTCDSYAYSFHPYPRAIKRHQHHAMKPGLRGVDEVGHFFRAQDAG